jgi:hypothetical protein
MAGELARTTGDTSTAESFGTRYESGTAQYDEAEQRTASPMDTEIAEVLAGGGTLSDAQIKFSVRAKPAYPDLFTLRMGARASRPRKVEAPVLAVRWRSEAGPPHSRFMMPPGAPPRGGVRMAVNVTIAPTEIFTP